MFNGVKPVTLLNSPTTLLIISLKNGRELDNCLFKIFIGNCNVASINTTREENIIFCNLCSLASESTILLL